MRGSRTGSSRLLLRVAIYLLIIVVLLLVRGGIHLDRLGALLHGAAATPDTTLTIAGGELAPQLLQDLSSRYRSEYPERQVLILGGGTYQSLEDLINGRADVAITTRAPLPREQALFRQVLDDTAGCYVFALGAIAVVCSQRSAIGPLSREELRTFLQGGQVDGLERLYAADPNLGWWDAFVGALYRGEIHPAETADLAARVSFLADGEAVLAALRQDTEAAGLIDQLARPDVCTAADLRCVSLAPAGEGRPVQPGVAEVATGVYPLWHHLFACIRPGGDFAGDKFVTYVMSARGQRQIERAGFLPARRVAREIYLTRQPLGK
jgi:phosphate transport system substrate-binding protein